MGSTATAAPDKKAKDIDVTIDAARFVAAAPKIQSLPAATTDEVAFIGRSNVGKSSLLNTLMARRDLVRTSRTPGQTRTVNLFHVELRLRRTQLALTLVDLPGYGFAKMSQAEKGRVSQLLSDYVEQREGLKAVVQLLDLRHDPSAQDRATFLDLQNLATPVIVVATKADHVPRGKQQARLRAIAKILAIEPSAIVAFSSETKQGRGALWGRILAAVAATDADHGG